MGVNRQPFPMAEIVVFKGERMSNDNFNFRPRSEYTADLDQGAIGIEIIHRNKAEDVTAGALNTFVHGLMGAFIGLADQRYVGVACKEPECTVGRTRIENNVLEIRIGLPPQAFDRLNDVTLAVATWHQNCNSWQVGDLAFRSCDRLGVGRYFAKRKHVGTQNDFLAKDAETRGSLTRKMLILLGQVSLVVKVQRLRPVA